MHRRLALPLAAMLLAISTAACAGFPFTGRGGGIVVSPPDPGNGQGGGGNIGGGSGTTGPGDPAGPGGGDPISGLKPSLETPVPGQLQPRSVHAWAMTPTVDGSHVTVLLAWWSGPAPCSVLDSVQVIRTDRTITMTPFEGADPSTGGQVACPAIAVLRGTVVDLGVLAAGSYTLAVPGDLAPMEITVR